MVKFHTNYGVITLALYDEQAPLTVKSFLAYVSNGHYDNTVFHRVIDNFMIQGGGFDLEMNQKKTLEPIQNEASNGLKNETYTIAMLELRMFILQPHSFLLMLEIITFSILPHQQPKDMGTVFLEK